MLHHIRDAQGAGIRLVGGHILHLYILSGLDIGDNHVALVAYPEAVGVAAHIQVASVAVGRAVKDIEAQPLGDGQFRAVGSDGTVGYSPFEAVTVLGVNAPLAVGSDVCHVFCGHAGKVPGPDVGFGLGILSIDAGEGHQQ